MTCDNRPNLAPICSTRPGTGAISTNAATPGTALCTTAGTLNLCAMCADNAATVATCSDPATQSVVCSNYDSSSLIRPAPACASTGTFTTLNNDLALPITLTCSNGTPECPEIPAPTCAGTTAQCSGAFGNADNLDRGVLSCTNVAPGGAPVCSVVPGAVRLDGTNKCTAAGAINFACGDIIEPQCAAVAGAVVCPTGTTNTCNGIPAGRTKPICSPVAGEVAGSANANCADSLLQNC